jgi:hypothetical protein
MERSLVTLAACLIWLVSAGATTKNFTLEEYLHLPDAQKDAAIIALAFEDADFAELRQPSGLKRSSAPKPQGVPYQGGKSHRRIDQRDGCEAEH